MFSWATYSHIVLWIILSILRKCLLSLKHTKDITMVLHFHLLNGILMLAIGAVGICGNCFCIVYFGQACTRRNKGQTYFLFMFCLAIFDLVAIICCILCFALPHFSYEVCKKSNYCRDMNLKNNINWYKEVLNIVFFIGRIIVCQKIWTFLQYCILDMGSWSYCLDR